MLLCAFAGVSTLTYLADRRMRLAEHEFREDRAAVAAIARSFSYPSESTLSNAFKRMTERSPRTWRNC